MGVTVTSANSPYNVSGGHIDTGDIVDGGGTMDVLAGGIAQSTTVNAGGIEYVNAEGSDAGATLSGGEQNVSGLASDALVVSGGEQLVATSGTAADTSVNAGGYQDVYGTANNTTIGRGGEQIVYASGTANNTTIQAGGTEYVSAGGHAQNVTFSGAATLDLQSPSGLVGTITDLLVGDTIDFVDTSVTSAGISGTMLTVTTSGGGIASYQLSGQQANTAPILQSDGSGGTDLELEPSNSAPPANTSEVMFLSNNGNYLIYDLGGNAIVAAYSLGEVASAWQVAGLGSFNGTDTSDMMFRDADNGAFQVFDVSNNTITSSALLGQIGLEWQVSGFGDFSGHAGETDMLMRATSGSSIGAFDIYDISNNSITSAAAATGQIGLEWQVAGFGDFSGKAGETDMMLRATGGADAGDFMIFDISNNTVTPAGALITGISSTWAVAGFGDFSGNANETDMLLRNSNTGTYEIYDIGKNAIASSAIPMGNIGTEWTVLGFGDVSGKPNETDVLMHALSGPDAGEVAYFDISGNQITGAGLMGKVGTEWQVAGLAADPPSNASTARLVEAMAGFSVGGASSVSAPVSTTADLGAGENPLVSVSLIAGSHG